MSGWSRNILLAALVLLLILLVSAIVWLASAGRRPSLAGGVVLPPPVSPGQPPAAPAGLRLQALAEPLPGPAGADPGLRRQGQLDFDPQAFADPQLRPGSPCQFEFFGDPPLAGVAESVTRTKSGTVIVSGRLDGDPLSSFVLTERQGKVLLSLTLPKTKQLYLVRYHQKDGKATLFEYDSSALPPSQDLPALPARP